MPKPIRIVLVDDHPVVRSGIRTLLEKAQDLEIVGEAERGEAVRALVAEVHPDVLLLDMELPDIDGIQVAKQIQQSEPGVKILALSAHDDPVYIRGLLEAGAAGYLMKEEAPEAIIEAVRGVAQGDKGWVSRKVAARVAAWMEAESKGTLSAREQDVLRLVVQGKTNQAIGVGLGISEKTVEKHVSEILVKLGVTSRVEAAVHAVRAGLVK
jgi:DNA-binding NarL/FixJ family response regulator